MPGFGMTMGMGLTLRQSLQQRMELAQRLEMRQELRLALVQRMEVNMHGKMAMEGVEDPFRVRFFEMPMKKGKPMPMAAKIIDSEKEKEGAGYLEVANQLQMKELGFAVPEVVGVMQTGKNTVILSEFVKDSASVGTLLSKHSSLRKYLQKYGGTLTAADWQVVWGEKGNVDKLELIGQLVDKLQKRSKPPERLWELSEIRNNMILSEEDFLKIQVLLDGMELALSDLPDSAAISLVQVQMDNAAYLIGQEVSKMHGAGVLKKDMGPRNFLVTLENGGVPKIWQTGFGKIEFKPELSRKERLENLKQMAEEFATFSNANGLEKQFLRGYLGRKWEGQNRVIDLIKESEEESGVPRKGVDEKQIRDQVKARLAVLLGRKGYVANVEGDAEASEVKTDLSAQIEQYIFNCPEVELRMRYDRTDQPAFQKIVKMIQAALGQTVGLTYQEVRAHRVLDYLFGRFENSNEASLADIENCEEDELRMHASQASRLVAPVLEKFNLPNVGNLTTLFDQSIVLRLKSANLELPDSDIMDLLVKQFNVRLARRTVAKYSLILKEAGKLPKLDGKTIRRLKNHFENVVGSGGTVELEDFAKKLGLAAADLAESVKKLVDQYLDKQIAAAVADHRLDRLDAVELAMRLNLPISDVVEKIEKIGGNAEPEVGETVDEVEAAPETPEEVFEETALPVREILRVAEAQPVMPVPAPVRVPAPLVPTPVVEDRPVAPAAEVPDVLMGMVTHIVARIQADPAYGTNRLAAELGLTETKINKIISTLEETHRVLHWRPQVDRLIRTRPHIEDDGLMEVLGIDVLTIHLCVRPMLMSGQIRI